MGKTLDLAGRRFEMLTAIRPDGLDRHGTVWWVCRCDCGAEKRVRSRHLSSGVIGSCGCGKRRNHPDHYTGPRGAEHGNWKGGRRIYDGYAYVNNGNKRYVAEHRLVANAPKGMVVHHIDENPLNNAPENLRVMTRGDHIRLHRELEKARGHIRCLGLPHKKNRKKEHTK